MAITLKDLLTSSGKYPEREKHKEVTPEVIKNAETLLKAVNSLLTDLKIDKATVSSGFRPSDVNSAIPNAAKKSLHMIGCAIDIADADGALDKLIESRDDLKKKYGLWQENPGDTKGWMHLDNKDRGKRSKNTFNP